MKYDELKKTLSLQTKPRCKPRHIESSIQQACVLWFRVAYPRYLIFSVPNGGSRNAIEAANLKREGALAGVSDLIVVADRAVMFVEMKKKGGRQQETQKEFQKNVERLGHTYALCYSLNDFQLAVERWLKLKFGYDIQDK